MRTLNRRLLRWRRYARRTCWNPRVTRPAWCGPDSAMTAGHTRAWDARERERERRCVAAYDPYPGGECYCGGCIGVGPCENEPRDDYRCCLAGDDGHPGPCVTACEECGGDGRCPDCGGQDDLGCTLCDGSGSCPARCDDGELVEDLW